MTGTHNLPVEGVELKPHRKPDYVVKMEARIAELEAENAALRAELKRWQPQPETSHCVSLTPKP